MFNTHCDILYIKFKKNFLILERKYKMGDLKGTVSRALFSNWDCGVIDFSYNILKMASIEEMDDIFASEPRNLKKLLGVDLTCFWVRIMLFIFAHYFYSAKYK